MNMKSRLPHLMGRWNGLEVSVLRDTGSDGVIVKRDLCKQEDFVGGMGRCVFVDGSEVRAPMVRVKLDTPYFVGTVRALAMASPFFDVIVGNVEGATKADAPNASWKEDNASSGWDVAQEQLERVINCHVKSSSDLQSETCKSSCVSVVWSDAECCIGCAWSCV